MKKFLYNRETKQIHRLQELHPMCHVDPDNRKMFGRCGGFIAWILLTFCGYDGCAWCYQEKHNPSLKN